MSSEPELGLRLDTKYNRIYIHRATLKAIGNPEFVVLGIYPKGQKLVVLPSVANVQDALRVRYAADNTFCIHSKPLLDGIRTMVPQFDQPRSYLLRGKLMSGQLVAAFDMNEVESIIEAE